MTERVRHVWIRPEHSPTERPGLVLERTRAAIEVMMAARADALADLPAD